MELCDKVSKWAVKRQNMLSQRREMEISHCEAAGS